MTRQIFQHMRRRSLMAAGLIAAGLVPAIGAAADAFPSGPVKIIVPFPPGGPTDTVGRLIAQKLQDIWQQPVVIDYKPGAGTAIGADFVAKSAPDGQTIGIVNSSFAVNASLRKNLPYDTLKDLSGITQIANLELAIVARTDAPFNTLPELIAYAKAHPGQLSYGTPGAGGTTHLGAELLQREAGFTMLHVPFKGSAPAHTELIGGRIDLVVDPFLSVVPFVKAGRMKMIATIGDQRVPGFDYPTVAETIPGFKVGALLGFVAPHGTPDAVLQKIQQDTAAVLRGPDLRKRIEDQGMTVVTSTPAQFNALISADMKRWAKIIAEAGITVE